MISKIINYVKSSIEEMKKVTWPTKKETNNYIILVVIISLGTAAFLGALDYGLTTILNLVIQNK